MTIYRTRRRPFAREEQWSLEDTTLAIEQTDQPPQIIPLSDVVEVRLEYAPSRFDWNLCICRLKLRDGRKLVCNSEGHEGGSQAAAVGRDYVAFVRELHRSLVQLAPACQFWAGASRRSYGWQTALLGFAVLMVLGAVVFFMRVGWTESGPAKIAAAIGLLPVAFLWIARNRPRRYAPDQIPPEVLPRGN